MVIAGFSFGHSALGAGVTVTIVRISKVGVKSGGMVGEVGVRGMNVLVGKCVACGDGETVNVGDTDVGVMVRVTGVTIRVGIPPTDGEQATSKKAKSKKAQRIFSLLSETDKRPLGYRYGIPVHDNCCRAASGFQGGCLHRQWRQRRRHTFCR